MVIREVEGSAWCFMGFCDAPYVNWLTSVFYEFVHYTVIEEGIVFLFWSSIFIRAKLRVILLPCILFSLIFLKLLNMLWW